MPSPKRHRARPREIAVVLLVLGATGASAGVEVGDIGAIHAQTQRALEIERTGTSTDWRSGTTGATGTIRIISTDHSPGSQPCRRYEWTIIASDGARMQASGEGCRISAGVWSLDEKRALRTDVAPRRKVRREPRPSVSAPTRAETPAASRPSGSTPDVAVPSTPATPPERTGETAAGATPANPVEGLTFTRPPRSGADRAGDG